MQRNSSQRRRLWLGSRFEEIVEPIARSFDNSGMSEAELDELITETKRAVRQERRRDR